jgi:predicted NBD/HSP70 family sugar kinase
MFQLPMRTWILNAAAVFSGRHGAVTRQAEQAGCSRETVYQHAHKLEQRLAEPAPEAVAQLQAENQRLREAIATLQQTAEARTLLDKDKQRQLATTTFAMGLSLRQIEDLFGLLLPAAEVPDHATLGRWVGDEARRAGAVLAALDPACAPRVRTLALDEIFFGGDRPWWGSNRRA